MCITLRSQNFSLSNSKFFSSNLFLHDRILYPKKGILLIAPLKATSDSQRFWFWHCGVQFDSTVWCTPRSLTLRLEAHHRAWLRGWKHTAELDSAVGCTPQSCFWESWYPWLCGMIQTAELDSALGCTPRSFSKIRISWRNRNRIRKYFSLFFRGPDGFESHRALQ